MRFLQVVLPLVSVLIGGGITYWLNVKTRHRTKAEEIFHDAIAAVSVAVAAHDFVTEVAPWRGAQPEDHARFVAQLGMEGNTNYVRAVAEARAALARASAYEPALREYTKADPSALLTDAEAIIDVLRARIDKGGRSSREQHLRSSRFSRGHL